MSLLGIKNSEAIIQFYMKCTRLVTKELDGKSQIQIDLQIHATDAVLWERMSLFFGGEDQTMDQFVWISCWKKKKIFLIIWEVGLGIGIW